MGYDKSKTLTVTAGGALTGVYRVRFYTRLDDSTVYGGRTKDPNGAEVGATSSHTAYNTAKLTVEGDDKTYQWTDSKGDATRNFDKPSGNNRYYDADTRTITWTLLANQAEIPYQQNSFKIYDKLPDGLEFIAPYAESVIITSDGEALPAEYQAQIAVEGNLLTISITGGAAGEAFTLPVKVVLKTRVTDAGMDRIFQTGTHTFKNQGYQSGRAESGTAYWEGDWEDCPVSGLPITKKAEYRPKEGSIGWTVEINPNHQAIIDTKNTVQQKIADKMTVTGLSQGGAITPTTLVAFAPGTLELVRSSYTRAPNGQSWVEEKDALKLESLPSADAPNEPGNYYHYDPDSLTLTVYVDTSEAAGGASNNKYTLTYATRINVPYGYTGKDVVTVQNGVNWKGYDKNAQISAIALAQVNASMSIKNAGEMVVTKVDGAEPATALSGAEFALYQKGTDTPLETYLTKSDGTFIIRRPAGAYTLVEAKAPEGYALDAAPRDITIEEKKTLALTITNARILGAIRISKVDAGMEAPLSGAEFTLYAVGKDGAETVYTASGFINPATTGADGVATFQGLPAGTYAVRETKAAAGYKLDSAWSREAVIGEEQAEYTFSCANDPILGRLQVMKVSDAAAADGSRVPLSGARFELLASDKATVVATSALTNQAGLAAFPDLRLGTYYLREIVAPEGYDLSAEPREVILTENPVTVSVFVENHKTDVPPENPDRPAPPPDDDTPDDDTPVRVVDPGTLTPEEVETLIEDGYVPLDDRPGLTPEQIIEEDIPLVLIPDEDVPLAVQPGLPQTGDGTPVALLAVLLAASLTGLAILLRKPRHNG